MLPLWRQAERITEVTSSIHDQDGVGTSNLHSRDARQDLHLSQELRLSLIVGTAHVEFSLPVHTWTVVVLEESLLSKKVQVDAVHRVGGAFIVNHHLHSLLGERLPLELDRSLLLIREVNVISHRQSRKVNSHRLRATRESGGEGGTERHDTASDTDTRSKHRRQAAELSQKGNFTKFSNLETLSIAAGMHGGKKATWLTSLGL